MADHGKDQSPQGKDFAPSFGTLENVLHNPHFVDAKQDPWKMADEKDEHDAHEDDGEVVLELAPGPVAARRRRPQGRGRGPIVRHRSCSSIN